METTRIKIKTSVDRPNMTYDILTIFVRNNVDINWMEVYTFVLYIKFPKQDPEKWQQMKSDILKVDGVSGVEEIDLIAFEEREVEIRTVLDVVSQGIIVAGKDFHVKYINRYAAENIFFVPVEKAINRNINNFLPEEKIKTMSQRLKETGNVENVDVQITNRNYFISMNEIKSGGTILCGYIITMQDTKEIGEMINRKRYNNPITFSDIIGNSTKFTEVIHQAKMFAQSDSPILIMGESGTGKELFARAIHNMSSRSSKPFIAVNCAAIPDQLLESELFGYEDGTFTGARKNGKTGLLEDANGGTLFLDEIGEMAPHLQAKLLRVLQESKIRRLGGHKEVDINVRILTATNRDIYRMVEKNQFRLDLLYRINTFSLMIPPLRDRRDDIKVLVDYFVAKYRAKYKKDIKGVSPSALKKLYHYDWPGNVRELQNVIERAAALARTKEITADDIAFCSVVGRQDMTDYTSLKGAVEATEKKMILEALSRHKSIRQAAKALDVTHTLLLNRMKKYGINESMWK